VKHVLDRRPADPRVEAQAAQIRREAVEMRVEAEEPPVPDMHNVICAVTPSYPEVEHRDPGLVDRAEVAIDKGGTPLPEPASVDYTHVM
jgi:hypothetical protein